MKSLVILVLASVFISCNTSQNKDYVNADVIITERLQEHPGKKLMETNCNICHSVSASHDDRLAPPMIAIKKHYLTSDTSKEEFINAMQTWIKNPNVEDAKMFGAVNRFGVMPKQAFPEETIQQIAEYMFENNIEQPDWFQEHFNQQNGKQNRKGQGKGMQKQQEATNFDNLPYGERGLNYAITTKTVLGKNLMGTIQKKGVLEALVFCNEKAYPLTDSMSVVHNATIKRVSDKPRNPNNKANTEELEYIKQFKQVVANHEEPNPIVKELNSKVQVYYPIITNTMCLQCHGKPNETIKESTFSKLTSLYPKDKAVGYDINEVRGIWSITFNK